MSLAIGSSGQKVRELQSALNALPTIHPRLVVDGVFGPKTRTRVLEFQKQRNLKVDGVAGPLTWTALIAALEAIGQAMAGAAAPPPAVQTSTATVWSINQLALGMTGVNGLIQQIIPAIGVIDVPTFRPGVQSNTPLFTFAPPTIARLGIFAAAKNGVERAVILVLPPSGVPDRVMIGIGHGFAQNVLTYQALGWDDPLSPDLIRFVLLKHVINRWGAQVLAGKKPMALMHIVRAAGVELGPFANDGLFTRDVLTQLRAQTNNAFSFETVEAFSYSSGISDFTLFVNSISSTLNVGAVYNIDPKPAMAAPMPAGGVRKQYLSGETGASFKAGFESMLRPRWQNEMRYPMEHNIPLKYLHNHCLPDYTLFLGIQTS
jgi:hypothetical protein